MKNDNIKENEIKIILDTDVGSDCDDMLALACLLRAERDHRAEILAITHCLRTEFGAPAISATMRYFGREDIPIGVMNGGAMLEDHYAKKLTDAFADASDMREYPSAVRVLRSALAASSGGVTIVAIGQMTNIADLLLSEADDISDLCGSELVFRKCDRIVVMGGSFLTDENGANIPSWNIKWDIDSAKHLFDIARVPVFALLSETGMSIPSGKRLMERFGDKNPVTHAFFTFLKKIDQRPSWDPMAVLFALDLTEDMLDVKSAGKILVDERGATYFEPCCNGNHYVLTLKEREGMRREEVEALAGEFIDNYAEAFIEDFCR